jgi:ferredoxin-NADP reductase
MIPALIAFFLIFSGGGSGPFLSLANHFQSATKGVVVETARRDAAHAVLKEMEAAIKKYEKDSEQTVKTLTKLGGEYHATAEQYRAMLDAQEKSNVAFQEAMVARLRELKRQISAAEWAEIVAKMKPKPAGS